MRQKWRFEALLPLFFWCVLFLVFCFCGLPALRWGFCRISCALQMKKICREKKMTLHPAHFAWFLGTRYGKKYDLFLKTPRCVYAVKLFGVARRRTQLLLLPEGCYSLRRYFGLSMQVRFSFDSKPEPFPSYILGSFSAADEKPVRRVLLLCPAPMDILDKNREGESGLFCCGDTYAGMEVMTMADFADRVQ